MRITLFPFRERSVLRLALGAALTACLLFACRLSQEGELQTTISFNELYDSLKQYDSVVITLKDPEDGHTIDVPFQGKVLIPGDLEKKSTPHWDGGKVLVSVNGYDAQGRLVYRMESIFDGRTNKRDSAYVYVRPGMGLGYALDYLNLLEGDSLPFPPVTVTPPDLADKRLQWSSSAPDVVGIGSGSIQALQAGNAQVTVRMAADTAKSLTFRVTVFDRSLMPEGISLSADSLFLSARGASGRLGLSVIPSTAAKEVEWATDNASIAIVNSAGVVSGLKPGTTWLRVHSVLKPSLGDSARVIVSDPVPAERVVFSKESTEVYLGGSAESLLVSVFPPKASQEVDFLVSRTGVLQLEKGWIRGLSVGEAMIIARAKEDAALSDTLKVRISPHQAIESVTLGKKAFTLFTGGEDLILAASIEPSGAVQEVQWRSGNPAVATVTRGGKVTGMAPGRTRIYAISQADSTRQDSAEVLVKTDMPKLSVGRADTNVALGASVGILPVVASQEYGLVTGFKWDIDGIPGWDDSSGAVKALEVKFDQEKEYVLRFYVRDTEGNEVIVTKKVRAVAGSVVNIISPLDGAYVNKAALLIVWTIDGVQQASGTDTVLKNGANVITRSAKDGTGRISYAAITVYLDSIPPAKPLVRMGGGIATALPTWTWAPGGGGAGVFRVAVDSESFAGGELRDTAFTPVFPLSEGIHTLFVQERDAAGNWSASGKGTFTVDLSGPGKPAVKVNVVSPTNAKRPQWTWSSGGNGGSGRFQYQLGNAEFPAGGKSAAAETTYTPASNLGDGIYTLFVRERDSLGNWSQPGSASVTVDTTSPGAPKVFGATPTNASPRWTWVSGAGGSGTFRYKVGGEPAEGAPETRDTAYEQPPPFTKTTYTLFIQERDAAGNWSPVTAYAIDYDVTKPMVAFTAPQTSGTYLTSNATVDLAGTASSPQGSTSAIRSVTYSADGVPGALATNFAEGKWSIKALPLANNKTVAVKVIATDAAGNQGEATLYILRDDAAPAAPEFTVQPPAFVNKTDPRTNLLWTWSRTGEATDSFVVKLNGAEVARQTGTSYTVSALSDGMYKLDVAEKDLTGNVSAFASSNSVLVDRAAPDAPVISIPATPTRNSKPTWNWGSGGSGQFEYRMANGADPTGGGIAIGGTSYTPANALADGAWHLQVREKDAAGNWSSWSASGVVVIKSAAPAAPSVLRNASPTNAPKWTWSSGGGGNGAYRYRWSGNTVYLGEGTSTEYAPNLADGTYNLCVSERDAVGYGTEACASLAVDKTAPLITKLLPAEGFITNKPSVSVSFEKDGVTASFNCDLVDGASKLCSQTVSDAAGNSVTVSRTVWYRSNVVFVKAGGAGDGSSWDGAYGDIGNALQAIEERTGRIEVWVTEGQYQRFILTRSYTSIYGGFRTSGYPNTILARDPFSRVSRIRADSTGSMISVMGQETGVCRDAILDGFQIHDEIGQALGIFRSENIRIRKFWIERNRNEFGGAGLVAISYGSAIFDSVFIRDNYSNSYSALYLSSGGALKMSDSELSNNGLGGPWGSAGMLSESGGAITLRTSRILMNVGGSRPETAGPFYQVYNQGGGVIDIAYCVVDGLKAGVYPSDDGSYINWGAGNTAP